MKKTVKFMATLMAVVMLTSLVPLTALAADPLNKSVNTVTDAQYYNVNLNNGSGGDYISFEYTGVSKDGTMLVEANTPITITMSDGNGYSSSAQSSNYPLGWHYGTNSTDYCLSTDNVFTMSDGTYNFEVSGFGSEQNANNTYAQSGQSMKTTFTLNSGLPAGTYTFNVSYKFEMKKWSFFTDWQSKYATTQTDTITIISKSYTDAMGGSIRVGSNSGLRFGFETKEDADTIKEYGFLYLYGETDTLTPETEGVKKLKAENFITHEEGTEDEYTTFNLVFTNVPKSGFETNITVCSYVVIDGVTHYSQPVTRNFRGVAEEVLADEDVDPATKEAISEMLNQ